MLSLFGMLIFFQLRDENSLRRLAALQKINEEIQTSARIKEIENRTFQEVQHLVHDLKSPLTAMQTLVGMLKMSSEMENRMQDVEYLGWVENGIMRMSDMISQILYEDQCSEITAQELLDLTLAQISATPYAHSVHAKNEAPEAKISVNRFLFPRALINLAQNSASAIPEGRLPKIGIKVSRASWQGADYISFCVSDNGRGIPPERQKEIWERSVSGTSSSGMGLVFLRRVVDRLGGEIKLESKLDEGTTIQIFLPEEGTHEN